MNVALLGFGVVGRGVYDILKGIPDINVKKVICLEDVTLPDVTFVKDICEITGDTSIDTVVEAMGGLHPAYEFVTGVIKAGKNIVTSNKALMAAYYDEFLELCKKYNVKIRCTAAVGGGISWLSDLERTIKVQSLGKVYGIMNGTCNYILDSMTQKNLDFADVLKEAQDLGFAERDPSADIDGTDTWNKIILSSNVAFGISLDRQSVPAAGIRYITADDINNFRKMNMTVKLIGTGTCKNGTVNAFVQPTLFNNTDPEASVPSNYNLITFEGKYSGRMSFYGQGAGRYPTAYNVVQDLVAEKEGLNYYCSVREKTEAVNDIKMSYYVRTQNPDTLPEGIVKEATGNAVITNPVSVKDIHKWLKLNEGAFIAALPE